MGNSHSNKKQVTDDLRRRVDGIPIWPPIQTNLRPYDVVKVGQRDGSVEHVGGGLTLQQLIGEDDWKNIKDKIEVVTRAASGFSFDGDSERMLELKTAFLESVELGLSANASKDLSIAINDREISTLQPKDGSSQPLQTLAKSLYGADIDEELYNIDKFIYVVTEVTDTEGFILSSSAGTDLGGNVKVIQEQVDAKIGHKNSSNFEIDGKVTISFKALRFKVKNGKITEKKKFVSQNFDRNGISGEANEETLADKAFTNEQSGMLDDSSSSSSKAKNKWALLIGNNDYSKSGMTSLGGCINDVDDMERFLLSRKFDPTKIDKNSNLTYEETVEKMDAYVNNTEFQEGDLLIFHYAGHGSERISNEEEDDDAKMYEQTIVPIDSFHNGDKPNSDISSDMIQGWVKELGDKGVRTMLFFDSCHSGGVIRGDDIPDDARATKGDERPKSKQNRPTSPSWADSSNQDRKIIGEKAIFLAACKSYQYAREIIESARKIRGAFTSKLISILEEGQKQATFVQLIDQLKNRLRKQNQTPDINGQVDTVAFCIDNLVLKSPLPYINVDIKPKGNKLTFDLPLMLPYVTKGSEYALFETSDVDMGQVVGTFTIDRVIDTRTSKATVKFNEKFICFTENQIKENEAVRLRAIETMHHPDIINGKHYTHVFVHDDFELEKLKSILSNLKAEMYNHRNKFPVKDLPRSCFIKVVEEKDAADVIVSYFKDESSPSQASYISVKNANDEFLLPQVQVAMEKPQHDDKVKTQGGEVHLVASYIASYAHWKMVQHVQNDDTELSESTINVSVMNQYGEVVEKNAEGYYDMEWDYDCDQTEPFSFKFELDSKEDYLLNIVSLDVDYGTYFYVHKEQDCTLSKSQEYVQACSKIMKMYEGTHRWCNPFSEWKFFVSTVRNNHDNNEEKGILDQAMENIRSECLWPSDYSNYDYEGEKTLDSRDKAKVMPRENKNDWTCISVKLKFDGFHNDYARDVSKSTKE